MVFDTAHYLFAKYNFSPVVQLFTVVEDFYPHLSKAEVLRKAGNQDFPFCVFKIDKSKRAPYWVHVKDLAVVVDNHLKEAHKDYANLYPHR